MTASAAIASFTLAAAMYGCGTAPPPLPPPTPAPDRVYRVPVAEVQLPNCAIPLPPVRDRNGAVAEDIRKFVKPDELCTAVTALKAWIDSTPVPPPHLEPGDWARVRSIDIWPMPPRDLPRMSNQGDNYDLHVYADIPERPRLAGVSLSARTGEMYFFLVHR